MLYCTVLRYIVVHICNPSIHPFPSKTQDREKYEGKAEQEIVVRSVVTVIFRNPCGADVGTRIVVKKESPLVSSGINLLSAAPSTGIVVSMMTGIASTSVNISGRMGTVDHMFLPVLWRIFDLPKVRSLPTSGRTMAAFPWRPLGPRCQDDRLWWVWGIVVV